MISREIKSVRCDDALQVLVASGTCVFFTLTTPDEVDYHEIAARWRAFSRDLFRSLRRKCNHKIEYVMNYEAHPGYLQKVVKHHELNEIVLHGTGRSHGWHIHGVVNAWLPVEDFRYLAERCGFGRVNLRRVTSCGVADYLTKHALKAYRGLTKKERKIYDGARLRLVNTSRGLPPLSDYHYRSSFLDHVNRISNEQRQNELILRPCKDLKRIDYRRIRVVSEIAAVCDHAHIWDFWRMVERLQLEKKIKKVCHCNDLLAYITMCKSTEREKKDYVKS